MQLNIPPKYNKNGDRQLWFVETKSNADELINVAIHGFLIVSLLVGLSFLL